MKKKNYISSLLMFFVASVLAQNLYPTHNEGLENLKNKIVEKQKQIYEEKTLVLKLDSTIHSNFDDWDSSWLAYEKVEYSHNSNGLIKEKITGDLFNNIWTPYLKEVFNYTLNNEFAEIIFYLWDFNQSNWKYYNKATFLYNGLDLKTELIVQYWDELSMTWTNDYREVYTYNSYDNRDSLYTYTWIESANSWALENRAVVQYNSNQEMTSSVFDFWTGNMWISICKIDYQYDNNGFLIKEIFYQFSSHTMTYVPAYRTLFTNNSSGLVLLSVIEYNDGNSWITYSKIGFVIDANNYVLSEINYLYDFYSSTWSFHDKIDYFYSNLTSVNEFVKEISVTTYPNPASDILIVNSDDEISNLRIFNINGQLIASFNPASKETTIDVSKFANGVYFVHTLSNDRNSVQKIIVQH